MPNLGVLLPHRYDIELVRLSLICAPHASYPWSSDSWEVPLIWPMRWEMIETVARTLDASEIVVFSISRMACVKHLDLGSSMMSFYPLN